MRRSNGHTEREPAPGVNRGLEHAKAIYGLVSEARNLSSKKNEEIKSQILGQEVWPKNWFIVTKQNNNNIREGWIYSFIESSVLVIYLFIYIYTCKCIYLYQVWIVRGPKRHYNNQSISQERKNLKRVFRLSPTNIADSKNLQDTRLCELPLGVHLLSATDASYLGLTIVLKISVRIIHPFLSPSRLQQILCICQQPSLWNSY